MIQKREGSGQLVHEISGPIVLVVISFFVLHEPNAHPKSSAGASWMEVWTPVSLHLHNKDMKEPRCSWQIPVHTRTREESLGHKTGKPRTPKHRRRLPNVIPLRCGDSMLKDLVLHPIKHGIQSSLHRSNQIFWLILWTIRIWMQVTTTILVQ